MNPVTPRDSARIDPHPPVKSSADGLTSNSSGEHLAQSRAEIAAWLQNPAAARASAATSSLPAVAIRGVLGDAAKHHPWALVAAAAAAGAVWAFTQSSRSGGRPSVLTTVAAPVVAELASRWLRQAWRSASTPERTETVQSSRRAHHWQD